jgi:Domain of unknown function (DUF4440)
MKKTVCICVVIFSVALTCAAAEKAAPVDQKTHDSILAMEKQLWEAWKNKDSKPFEERVADDGVAIGIGNKTVTTKSEFVNDIKSSDCDVRRYSITEDRSYRVGKGAVLLVYRADQDATCRGSKIPDTVYASSLWLKRDGKWQNFSHQETPVTASASDQKPETAGEKKPQ